MSVLVQSEPGEVPALEPWSGWGTRSWEWDSCSLMQGRGTANMQPGSQHRGLWGRGCNIGSICTARPPHAAGPWVGGMKTSCKVWEEAGGGCPYWQDGPMGTLWVEVEVSLRAASS